MGNISPKEKSMVREPMFSWVYKIILPGRMQDTCDHMDYTMSPHSTLYHLPSKIVATNPPFEKINVNIPVLFTVPDFVRHPYILYYFHGNAETLRDSYPLMETVSDRLGCACLAIEYPGYGETGKFFTKTTPRNLDQWATEVFDLLVGYVPDSIDYLIPFGRSIGTGPASKIAEYMYKQNAKPKGLILNAPYISLRAMAKEMVGWLSIFAGNAWDNEESLGVLRRPLDQEAYTKLLILHGQQDEIVPFEHGKKLSEQYIQSDKDGMVDSPTSKGHNDYDLENFTLPIELFLMKYIADKSISFDDARLNFQSVTERITLKLKEMDVGATPDEPPRNHRAFKQKKAACV